MTALRYKAARVTLTLALILSVTALGQWLLSPNTDLEFRKGVAAR